MKSMFVVIVHNVRSAHNVGSIFRTSDGAGVEKLYLTGYTPAPATDKDVYLTQAHKTLAKTALGAEKNISWEKGTRLAPVLTKLKQEGFEIIALEQDKNSMDYREYKPKGKTALLVGNEVKGVDKKVLGQCDRVIEIPMHGKKNSLNVSVAFGIAAYHVAGTMRGVNR